MIGLRTPAVAIILDGDRATVVSGWVIKRTVEEAPRYDLMLPGGRLINDIPCNLITEKRS